MADTASGGERILLVEDEEVVRDLTVRMLRGEGYQVLSARDGHEALHLLRDLDQPIDLLITDVVMPGMSGAELGNRVMKEMPSAKVLYVSGYLKKTGGEGDLVSASVPFLQKPYTPRELAEKVREILGAATSRA